MPVYDFLGLDFNFSSHLELDYMDFQFRRISDEPIANVPAIFAYYPSLWTKDNRKIISLNIAWVGVLEA